jgi:hypothetical protein
MTYKYFSADQTIEQARSEFRKLCLELHPDKGGNEEEFKSMKNEYDGIIKILSAFEAGNANRENRRARYTYEMEQELAEKIESMLNIPGIIIEICGSWLWIAGNTFPVHELIKAQGCKFSGKKKLWYWSADMGAGKVRGRYTMEKIRNKFGSEIIESETEGRKALAA